MTSEKRKEYMKKYRQENKEKLSKGKIDWAKNNPEKVKESTKKYLESNKEKIKKKQVEYMKKRYNTDLEFRKRVIRYNNNWRKHNIEYVKIRDKLNYSDNKYKEPKKPELKDDWLPFESDAD